MPQAFGRQRLRRCEQLTAHEVRLGELNEPVQTAWYELYYLAND